MRTLLLGGGGGGGRGGEGGGVGRGFGGGCIVRLALMLDFLLVLSLNCSCMY